MNVHRDSLNGMIYAKITPIFGTVKSYIENYNTYKKFRFQREFLNVNYICDYVILSYEYNESSHQFVMT